MRRSLRIRTLLALLLFWLGSAMPALAQGADPRIARARAAFGAGQVENGLALLQAVLAEQPENPLATHLMGYGLHVAGRRDEALEWHRKATRYPSVAAPSHYNIACVYALEGRKDEAFAELTRARAAGFADRALAEGDSDLAALHDDPRYAEFLRSFEPPAPFPSGVRVLRAIEGEAPGDQFGWIARKIGDVDGDGVADFVTSAPTKAQNGAGAGRVYVFSSKSGAELWHRDGVAGSFLGMGLEAAGDVDGDGRGDVIAGAPGVGRGDSHVLVLSGHDGRELLELRSGESSDRFGRSVAGVGDLDGDGRAELLVGAPAAQDGGRAYLFSGRGKRLAVFGADEAQDAFGSCVAGGAGLLVIGAKDAGMQQGGRVHVFAWRDGGARPHFVIEGGEGSQELGAMFLSVVGDVNGDGTADVYASDWAANSGAQGAGRIHLYSGHDGARLRAIDGRAAGEGFGIGPARLGDWDGDGADDLVVGAWQSRAGAASGGRVAVHSGRAGTALWESPCSVANETFGFDAEGLGDVDGDGRIDLLITGAWSACRGEKSGRVWILSR